MKLIDYAKAVAGTVLLAISVVFPSLAQQEKKPTVVVASKQFTENYILAEIAAQKLEAAGYAVVRKFGLGGTGIVMNAVRANRIDVHPDYTGTISHVILKQPDLTTVDEIHEGLLKEDLTMTAPLGFNNSYGIAMLRERAQELGIAKISDLAKRKDLSLAFSYEFMEREDGYPALSRAYDFHPNLDVRPIDHSLVYKALVDEEVDVVDIYTTDAKIKRYDLVILEDDLDFFPKYYAVYVSRQAFVKNHPEAWAILKSLENEIDVETMRSLNAKAEIGKQSFSQIARTFLDPDAKKKNRRTWAYLKQLVPLTKQHLMLVFISLAISVVVGVPLGIAAAKNKWLGQLVLISSGILQTIPSLALLAFLIPFFGIGLVPSLIALFLYGLLPIVRGAYSGLVSLDPKLVEVGIAMGLKPGQRLRLIELPLATIHILNGIKTSAVINVGTATLAALIGAGGYGSLIITGLSLNNNTIIMQGAVPAAFMALFVHGAFEIIDRKLIPKGLRQ